MIAVNNINLKVPFNEKDQAKSLGARWNAEAKLWYVPQGVDATLFEKWLTSTPNFVPTQQATKHVAQTNVDTNTQFDDDIDAINAKLRDAYESNEEAFQYCMARRKHHNVYVIELSKEVLFEGKFKKCNPKYIAGKPCVYVGMTGLDPDVRFDKHKAGIQSNRYVMQYGLRLLPDLYEGFNPMTYDEAAAMEVEIGIDLRSAGFGVWQAQLAYGVIIANMNPSTSNSNAPEPLTSAQPSQPKNPLHGITLEAIVTVLVAHFGWDELAQRIPVNCFTHDPSIKSSLKFLRKTPWARVKVESLYSLMLRDNKRADDSVLSSNKSE